MAIVDRAGPPFAAPARTAPRGGAPAPAVVPPITAPRDRIRDLTALGLLAASAFLIVALASFHPADPPAPRMFPPHARATNACGLFGSTIATGLYEVFGLGAWFVVAVAVGFDIALLRRRAMPDLPLRAAGAALATVGVCTLLAMFLPDWIDRPLWGPGGRAGALGRFFAEAYLARAGAAIVVSAVTGAGLFLACDAVLLHMAGGLTAVVGGLLAAWRSAATRIAARRTAAPHTAADDAPAAFPGLRQWRVGRSQAIGGDADDDDDDEEDDSEPTIRVRRREPPVVVDEVAEEDVAESANETVEDEEEATDADPAAAPARAPVPIRSLASRRKPAATLELAPDPAADYELPSLDLLLPTEHLELVQQVEVVRVRARVLE